MKDRTELYFRKSGGRVGKGVQLSVTMAVRDPLKARGTEEGMGRLQRLGWLSCEANGTRGREAGLQTQEPKFASPHCLGAPGSAPAVMEGRALSL